MKGKKSVKTNNGVDDPLAECQSLEWKTSMTFGFLLVVAHFWFLKFLEDEYKRDYLPSPHTYIVRDYVSLWIPIFLSSIALEALFYKISKKPNEVYRLNDSLSSLCLGSWNQLSKKLVAQVTIFNVV